MNYELRRNERRNRNKAIVITILLYAGLAAWFTVGQDITLEEVVSAVWQPSVEASEVAGSGEVRPLRMGGAWCAEAHKPLLDYPAAACVLEACLGTSGTSP